MADYRMVARHVRWWRGQVHRWSTVWTFTGTLDPGNYGAAIAGLKTLEQGVNYKGATGVQGGLYEIALYNQVSGGMPIAVATYFDWTTPASWLAYTGAAWTTNAAPIVDYAEVALLVEWNAGLSRTGKPVKFKKWFHSVMSVNPVGGAVDVSTADQAGIATYILNQMNVITALGIALGRGSRLAALTPVVRPYYATHQMPRGRRKRVVTAAAENANFQEILQILQQQQQPVGG